MKISISKLRAYVLTQTSAEFTVTNKDSGVSKTYRLERARGSRKNRPWFVEVQQTETFWSYIGELYHDNDGSVRFVHGRESKLGANTRSVKGMKGIARWLTGGVLPPSSFTFMLGDGSAFSATLLLALEEAS